MTAREVAERLGGEPVLGRAVATEFDLLAVISDGLPAAVLDVVIHDGTFSPAEAFSLVLPSRTFARRKQQKKKLTAAESDRLARAMRLVAYAEDAIGDPERAARWMRKSNRTLAGKRPLDLLGSDTGTRLVEQVLGRIEHGLGA